MSKNRLTIASVILLGLIALTVVMVNARSTDYKPAPATEVKLPKVEPDKVDELEVSGADQPKTRLVKKAAEWRLMEPVDYKADQDAVSSAVKKLGEIKVTGTAATKKENHAQLEVTEQKATHVVAKSGGKVVIDAYLGSYDSGNTMLRQNGQDTVATVEGSIRYAFRKQPKDYRDKTITKVETPLVERIIFDNKHGHFEFQRAGDDWKQVLAKGQKRIEPLDLPKVKGIVGTASSLNASDFAEPGMTAEQAGLGASAATVTVKLSGDAGVSDILYRIGGQKDQSYYLQREGMSQIFVVSGWIGSRLTPKTDDFVKKDPPKTPAPATPPPSGAQQIDPAILKQLQQQMNPHAPH